MKTKILALVVGGLITINFFIATTGPRQCSEVIMSSICAPSMHAGFPLKATWSDVGSFDTRTVWFAIFVIPLMIDWAFWTLLIYALIRIYIKHASPRRQ